MGENLTFIKGRDKTAREIVRFLENEAVFCGFWDILLQLFPDENIAGKLAGGLADITGDGKESAARKVNNWMQGRNLPQNREALFQICFALKLGEQESNWLFGRISDTGIHYRNPEELAYAFALRTGMSYKEAVELKKQALSLYGKEQEHGGEKAEALYTSQLRDAFSMVRTREEFLAFIREHGKKLGKLHETAYEKFMELLDCLQMPGDAVRENKAPEKGYTIKQVLQEYIQMNVPVRLRKQEEAEKEPGGKMVLRQMVKKYWPNESMLVKMRTRKEDVSRKALLLLYLATEEYDLEIQEEEYDDWEEDADLRLEVRIEKMNLFLSSFGMNRLDAEQPFDFLVAYAMKTDGEEEARIRMENVLAVLFGEEDT